jgi:hypothetical protein
MLNFLKFLLEPMPLYLTNNLTLKHYVNFYMYRTSLKNLYPGGTWTRLVCFSGWCEAPRRVARWYICKPKIPIWIKFWGTWNGKCCYIFAYLEYVMDIWFIVWSFGNFLVIWYIFISFWYIVSWKIWQPWRHAAMGQPFGTFWNLATGERRKTLDLDSSLSPDLWPRR